MNRDAVRSSVAQTGKAMRDTGIKRHAPTGTRYFTGYGDTVYDWELLFDTIVLGYFGSTDLTINGIRIFLNAQREDGFIPRRVRPAGIPQGMDAWGRAIHEREEEEHCKPFLLQSALMVCRMRRDSSWLTVEDYRKLIRSVDHWMTAWDRDGNGLSEWASGPHSGADTQFERIGPWRS
ncbi:MAG TPA: hypothetical protein VFH83_13840, partial [Spirochaetia bacterium]|nr:hypothetical protein [Spirochaetia bacterium]